MNTKINNTNSVGVLSKALNVIAVLEHAREDLGLTEIANRSEINKTSCYRILQTLMIDNMVESGERAGTYRLGIRFLKLGEVVQNKMSVRQIALPILTKLTEEIGVTSYLVVLNNQKAVCLERIEGEGVQVLAFRLGDSWPLYQGAAPRAILANIGSEKVEKILSGPIEKHTPKTPTDPNYYKEMIKEIQKRGYSVSEEDVTLGIASIGAPIFDHKEDVIAAISISGATHKIFAGKEKNVAEKVIKAANDISIKLGWNKCSKPNLSIM